MEQNHENSFWRSNIKMVPGRPSPTKDTSRSTAVKAKNNNIANSSTSSFEKYQKSVSDAWTLSEDELTKEYCILTDDKIARRASQNMARAHKNPIAVVHRHQNSATSSSALTSINTNSATTSTANNTLETVEEDENQPEVSKPKQERKVSNEYG